MFERNTPLREALDLAVCEAYGVEPKDDVVAFLLVLNVAVASGKGSGESVVVPGLPQVAKTFQELLVQEQQEYSGRVQLLKVVGLLGLVGSVAVAGSGGAAEAKVVREVTFQLTYANRDLWWHGDAASPNSLVGVRPEARPIATDVLVTTLTETNEARGRRLIEESRVATEGDRRVVYAFTREKEKIVGELDESGRFVSNGFLAENRELVPSWPEDGTAIWYDSESGLMSYEVDLHGPTITESLDYLPLELSDVAGNLVHGWFSIAVEPARQSGSAGGASAEVRLDCRIGDQTLTLATGSLPRVFRRAEVLLGSFDNQAGTYLPEAAYRAGGESPDKVEPDKVEPSVTFSIPGAFTSAVRAGGEKLVVVDAPAEGRGAAPAIPRIAIDGKFDDWRNVAGVRDPRGNVVSYLEYVPDVDLLEFKVAHDASHLYLYARVAGQVGRTHPEGGRSYFYAYIDVDQNAGTGFVPSRDDECYYGVVIGDDCEVQFEFVDNVFRKSFYGFCGLGGDEDVLRQMVTIGASQYGRFDANGKEREHYKSEYIYRDGVTAITEDLKHGSSDSICVCVSPDGSEVEISSSYAGFLKDRAGRAILGPGRTIDIAAGMECDSKAYPGKSRWAADSTPPIRGYYLKSAGD